MLTYILLALGAISLTFFLLFRTKEGGIIPAALKTLTSLLFVATAVSGLIYNHIITCTSTSKLLFGGLVILGLVCGLIGDLTLDLKVTYQTLNIRHSDLYTFFGMIAFAIGHIFFITAVALFFDFSAWTILIAAGVTAAIFAISIFLLKMKFGKFLIPAVAYTFLLTLFFAGTIAAGIITGFSVALILLAIGSALFLLSDMVLSMTYFNANESRILIVINHVLYYAAQFLIALSIYYIGMTL
ncbi:MAG TPA: hypothetical protein DHV31_02950 [Clostridiales bacterium]|nr:hypothetical protein [Clostridiales bacterium]